MKKITLLAALFVAAVSANAQWSLFKSDGFEAPVYTTSFLCKGQQAWETLSATKNPVPATAACIWKDLYSDNLGGVATKTYQAEVIAGTRDGGSGSQILKITLPDLAFQNPDLTSCKIRLRGDAVDQAIVGNGVDLTSYKIKVWVKSNVASTKAIEGINSTALNRDSITVTSTWTLVDGTIKYTTGPSALFASIDFLRDPAHVDRIIYLDDYELYRAWATDVDASGVESFVKVVNGAIVVSATEGAAIEVYNVVGQKLASDVAVAGENTINVAAKGLVVVKVGGKSTKVVL